MATGEGVYLQRYPITVAGINFPPAQRFLRDENLKSTLAVIRSSCAV